MSLIAKIDYANTFVNGTQTSGQVFISLLDAASGQPANGNNVIITYQQNVNGTLSTNTVTIPGQTAAIYSGLLSDSSNGYFTNFTITDVGTVPSQPPPVGVCDLSVNYIRVYQPESAPGAADGQITISASSSYLPVAYSINSGSSWQSSPTFSGLNSGLVTVLVKDSNSLGCIDQASVTVPISSSLLVSDPSVTLTGGNISRWSAAFNPVVFTYQRKDFNVTSVSADTQTGNAALSVNCDVTPVESALSANTQALQNAAALNVVLTNINPVYIYLSAGPYAGTYQVINVTNEKLIIDQAFISNATGYVNINLLRPYYQVRTQITYQDPLTGKQNNIISVNRPDSTGLVKADISNFLQSLLRAKDQSNFTQANYRDSNLSASYQIGYAEYWDGKLSANQSLTYIPVSTPYYVLYAAKQLGEKYGGNLAAYVPFNTVTDNTQLAKWITDFTEPAYSNGYPFDIGFIYSDNLLGRQLFYELVPLDINRNPVGGGTQSSYLINDDGSWLLNQDGSKLVIASQTSLGFTLPAQLGLNRLLVNTNFDSDIFYFTLTLKYTDGNTTRAVTQTQTIRVDNAVDEQSVYLRWIGLSGSWNYYRFVYNQEISLDVQNAVIIKNYVSDWENQDGIEEVIGKSAGQKVKLVAEDLTVSDIKGLQSLKYSPKVQMLINKNPVKWQTIVINTASFSEYETLNGQAPFSITFNMPSINIQTQ